MTGKLQADERRVKKMLIIKSRQAIAGSCGERREVKTVAES
jgi:hypothetical protein